jgi:hypothetical protein
MAEGMDARTVEVSCLTNGSTIRRTSECAMQEFPYFASDMRFSLAAFPF